MKIILKISQTKNIWLGLLAATSLLGCSSNEHDSSRQTPSTNLAAKSAIDVYHNAKVYTVDPSAPWVEAIAVKNGKIIAVGSNQEVMATTGANSNKIDLKGKMIMPGIHDTHIHPSDAGVTQTLECNFRTDDLAEALGTLKTCVDNAKPGEWIRGGQWNEGYFVDNPKQPKIILDEIAPNNPVFLMDWSVHHAWVNTAALEKFNITKETKNTEGGSIQRDPNSGEATGLLYDNEAYSKRSQLPAYSATQETEALAWSVNEIIGYGITTIKDAIVTDSNMGAYQELYKTGRLPLRVKTNLSWKSAWALSHEAEKTLIKNHKSYEQDMITTNFVKIMLDGVPMTYTSAVLEPYEANDIVGDAHTSELMIPVDELIKDVVALDKQGMSIKIHATGDASARAALDAFEAARKANPGNNILHEVSHAEMIHPDDVARFKELNVAAEMCPTIWYPIPGLNWETWFGKDRLPMWQVKTMYDSGALVSYGSDWPVVPTANPWLGIEAMVTRSDPLKDKIVSEFVEEAVDLATAIKIFTQNSATANLVGESSGSLKVGKDADFIALDQNIFEVPITKVSDSKVLLSVINGKIVLDNR